MSSPVETISTSPLALPRSSRKTTVRGLTSAWAGKIVPVFCDVMLREDAVRRGRISVGVDMAETVFSLMNSVVVTVQAHLVPWLAFPKFDGIDDFNRAYQMVAPPSGVVKPFFDGVAFDRNAEFWKALGVHAPQGAMVNSQYLTAYNVLVEFLRKARSEKIADWPIGGTILAPAFWRDTKFAHILPDFDQAKMDGEVPLNIVAQNLPVRGITKLGAASTVGSWGSAFMADYGPNAGVAFHTPTNLQLQFAKDIYAEMSSSSVKVSLSNLELAKQTAAFAKMREQFNGKLTDDHLIDLLMQGVRVPDEGLKNPILLASKSTVIAYNETYATDGANLSKSVTRGKAMVDLSFSTPPINSGGVIIVTVQIVPEQLFERTDDFGLSVLSPDRLPQADRDFLDPEKAEVVPNSFVDVLHANPNGTFGYAPLNHRYALRDLVRLGGRFQRPVTGDNQDRQRVWTPELANPALNTNFFVVPSLPHTVFADTLTQPFEILTLGDIEYTGLTVVGPRLIEKSDDYQQVLSEVPTGRIVQP